MEGIVDLDRYPLDRPGGPEWQALVAGCARTSRRKACSTFPGSCSRGAGRDACGAGSRSSTPRPSSTPASTTSTSARRCRGLRPTTPPSPVSETVSRTLCADQMAGSPLVTLHRDPRFAEFLAAAMGKAVLYPMGDPLAAVNAMAYGPGEALNWHFDRSEFTTTILLQAPEAGGLFEYRRDLEERGRPQLRGRGAAPAGRGPGAPVGPARAGLAQRVPGPQHGASGDAGRGHDAPRHRGLLLLRPARRAVQPGGAGRLLWASGTGRGGLMRARPAWPRGGALVTVETRQAAPHQGRRPQPY